MLLSSWVQLEVCLSSVCSCTLLPVAVEEMSSLGLGLSAEREVGR